MVNNKEIKPESVDYKVNNSDLNGTSENKDIISSSGNFNKDDNNNNDNNDKNQGINNRVKYFDYNYTGLSVNSFKRVIKKNLKVTSINNKVS